MRLLLVFCGLVCVCAAAPASASAIDDLAPVARWTCSAPGLTCDPCTEHCTNIPFRTVSAGIPVNFDGRPSSDDRNQTTNNPTPRGPVNGTIAGYTWDFGGDGTGLGPQPTHTFVVPGTYHVKLTVEDNTGGVGHVDWKTLDIVATAAPPVARISAPAGTPVVGDSLAFDGTGSSDSDGTITSYAWTFGDGGTASAAQPHHTFTTAGSHTVSLTVNDNDPTTPSDTTEAHVTIVPRPVVVVAPPSVPLKPLLSELKLSHGKLTVKHARRFKLLFSLLTASGVSARVDRFETGHMSRGACVRVSGPGKKCQRLVRLSTLLRLSGRAGRNSVTLGKLAGSHRLPPGRYRITLKSSADKKTVTFRVVGK